MVTGKAVKETESPGDGMWAVTLTSQTLLHTYLQCLEVEITADLPGKTGEYVMEMASSLFKGHLPMESSQGH